MVAGNLPLELVRHLSLRAAALCSYCAAVQTSRAASTFKADDQVGPPEAPHESGGQAGRNDRQIGEHIVARRQEGGARKASAMVTVARQQECTGHIDRKAPSPASHSAAGSGVTRLLNFSHVVRSAAPAETSRTPLNSMPSRARLRAAQAKATTMNVLTEASSKKSMLSAKQRNRDSESHSELDLEIAKLQEGDEQNHSPHPIV
jgi:hypothetical protein